MEKTIEFKAILLVAGLLFGIVFGESTIYAKNYVFFQGSEYACAGGEQRVGDVNGDGVINKEDVNVLFEYVDKNVANICCGDVNNNGRLDFDDVVELNEFVEGKRNCFERGYSCSQKENCTDGIDNDCDGLIDDEDEDCPCSNRSCDYVISNYLDTLQRYDENMNGMIDTEELQSAIHDFNNNNLSKSEYCAIVNAWEKSCLFYVIDNLPPTIYNISIHPENPTTEDYINISATVADDQSTISLCQISVDGKEYQDMVPIDGKYDEKTEDVIKSIGELSEGEHNITIRCEDSANNTGKKIYILQVKKIVKCTETDEGDAAEVPGTCTIDNESFGDVCTNSINLIEYYCSKNEIKNKTYDCNSYCKEVYGENYRGTCSVNGDGTGFCNCAMSIYSKACLYYQSSLISDEGNFWKLYDHNPDPKANSVESIIFYINNSFWYFDRISFTVDGNDWRKVEVYASSNTITWTKLAELCCYPSGRYEVNISGFPENFFLKFVLHTGVCCGESSYVTLGKTFDGIIEEVEFTISPETIPELYEKCKFVQAKLPPCDSYGDVNGDGHITYEDANLTLQIVVSEEYDIHADVDGDNKVTSSDALYIHRYLDGEIKTFPVCEKIECKDTDNGNDPEIPGTCTINNKTFTDKCSDDKLIEYYCLENEIKNESYDCSYYCKEKYGEYYEGTCSIDENMSGFCDCTISILKNEKNSFMYTPKQVFLISDEDWRNVLSLIPIAVWTSEEDGKWCQKGYGTSENVCVYPLLIYHEEEEGFDADSIIYFFQQYKPDKVIVVGNAPQELLNLLVAEPALGAGLKEEQITKITLDDYLKYWNSFRDIVVVDYNNYSAGLIASTYASLINAPVIFVNKDNIESWYLKNRNVIIVGNIDEEVMNIVDKYAKSKEIYSVKDLQKKYAELTDTDKIILVNPDDLEIAVKEEFYPEKSSNPIWNLYTKTSLAAPILAGAKHELILTTKSTDYENVDGFIENRIKELFDLPKEEPKIGLTNYLEQETFEFFIPKDENGFEITFEITKDFERTKYEVFLTDILVDRGCIGKSISIRTDRGEKTEIEINGGALFGEIPYKGLYLPIPSNWIPQKGNNLTLTVTTTCDKMLILKGRLPKLDLFDGPEIGKAVQIKNKNEITETFTGIKPGHKIQTEVSVNQRFSYRLKIVALCDFKLSSKIEAENGKLKIEISNPSESFIYVEKVEVIPVLKEKFTLTILSSPKAIQLSRESGEWGSILRESLDPNVYADIYNNDFLDAKPGRIMGITLADVSSYIARDIFYNKLSKTKKALIMVKSTDASWDAERLRRGFEEIWTEELKKEFDSIVECYSYNDPELGCDTHSSEMREAYNSSEVVFFVNHGWTEGLWGIISTYQLNYLSPSVQIADACLTCSFDDAYNKGNLFCVNNLRKGSLGYIGADSVAVTCISIGEDKIVVAEKNREFLPKLFKEGKSLGDAYIEIYPKGDKFYFVLGDPTFKVRP